MLVTRVVVGFMQGYTANVIVAVPLTDVNVVVPVAITVDVVE